MRSLVLVAAVLATACSNAPDVIWLGQFESPCETSADCHGDPCLQIDGTGSCTIPCGTYCPDNYECDAELDVCRPVRAGACRRLHERCGPSYPACCNGTACVDFEGWGPRCATVDCRREGFGCDSGFCCIDVGTTESVCAPPTYCD